MRPQQHIGPFTGMPTVDQDGVLQDPPQTMGQQMGGPANASTPGLLAPGTIPNLYNRPVTASPAGPKGVQPGNWSTTYSKTFTADDPRLGELAAKHGKNSAVLLPTVVNGKFLTDQEAIDRYKTTGEHLGIFDRWQSAEPYATAIHNSQQAEGNFYGRLSKTPSQQLGGQ